MSAKPMSRAPFVARARRSASTAAASGAADGRASPATRRAARRSRGSSASTSSSSSRSRHSSFLPLAPADLPLPYMPSSLAAISASSLALGVVVGRRQGAGEPQQLDLALDVGIALVAAELGRLLDRLGLVRHHLGVRLRGRRLGLVGDVGRLGPLGLRRLRPQGPQVLVDVGHERLGIGIGRAIGEARTGLAVLGVHDDRPGLVDCRGLGLGGSRPLRARPVAGEEAQGRQGGGTERACDGEHRRARYVVRPPMATPPGTGLSRARRGRDPPRPDSGRSPVSPAG